MHFSIIAACDVRRGIGKNGTLPWRHKPDMDRFRKITVGNPASGKRNVVIMGRTTWLSLPEKFRPLPHRLNIVLSDEQITLPEGVHRAASFEAALGIANHASDVNDVFIIGGGSVYAQAMLDARCRTVYLTELEHDYECDTFFPNIPHGFLRTVEQEATTSDGISYRFVRYDRIPSAG